MPLDKTWSIVLQFLIETNIHSSSIAKVDRIRKHSLSKQEPLQSRGFYWVVGGTEEGNRTDFLKFDVWEDRLVSHLCHSDLLKRQKNRSDLGTPFGKTEARDGWRGGVERWREDGGDRGRWRGREGGGAIGFIFTSAM